MCLRTTDQCRTISHIRTVVSPSTSDHVPRVGSVRRAVDVSSAYRSLMFPPCQHHADNNGPAQQSAASSITAAEGQQLFAVPEVRATTDLEGVLPEGIVSLEVTGALPCTR